MSLLPLTDRPYMPDYGVVAEDEGSGLLPWSWAEDQPRSSANFWLATRWPDGRPHVMPVWAAFDDEALWVSGGLHSRKVQNLLVEPRCVLTTEDARNPLVVGVAEQVGEDAAKQDYLQLVNHKYGTDYQLDFLDPATTAVFSVRPVWAFALLESDFSESPTRWRFSTS